VQVRGIGLWTPGFPGLARWLAGECDPAATRPTAALLQGATGRRATELTRAAVEALAQAARAADADLARVATVWATAHGEHQTSVEILEMLHRGEGRLSPTRFHNSVHNTAAGYASIATANRAVSTTVSAGPELWATALLEAFCLLAAGEDQVVVVAADEPMRPPFPARGARAPLALALWLAAGGEGASGGMRLEDLRRSEELAAPSHPRFGGLYVSAGLPLVEALATGRPGRVALELDAGQKPPYWGLRVAPSSADGSP